MTFHIGSGQSCPTPVWARIKYDRNGEPLRAICGRPRPCPGLLANFTGYDELDDTWYVTHPHFYRLVRFGWYAVLRPEQDRRWGYRRPLILGRNESRYEKTTVGHAPVVPIFIYCAQCGTPNWVDVSDDDDGGVLGYDHRCGIIY